MITSPGLLVSLSPCLFFQVTTVIPLIVWLIAAGARAEPQPAQFMAGLRERGLYQLADEWGSEQWERSELSERQRAELAIQLALVYTEQALASPPEARDAFWSKADGICAKFVEGWPDNPRRSLVEVQRALVSLERDKFARQENMAVVADGGDSAAIAHLRMAARGLADVSEAVGQLLVDMRLRPQAKAPSAALTASELESVEANIAYYLARAQRQLGLCYPQRSADRDNAMLQAVTQLTPLAQRVPADELAWKARVELAACLRALGRLQHAKEFLDVWARESMPDDVAPSLAAEKVRVLVASGEVRRAQDRARLSLEKYPDDGELALAALEAELTAWQQLAPSAGVRDSRDLIVLANEIHKRYGAYWGRRAQLLLGNQLAATNAGAVDRRDAEGLLVAAKHFYVSGQTEKAVANYDAAAARLEQQGNLNEAFAASMTAAAIERAAGRLTSAADRYRRLALETPTHERAAEAHQLAILCVAEYARGSTPEDRPRTAADYERLLNEHLAKWPDATSSDSVRLWSGKLLAARGDCSTAIGVLSRVRPDSEPYAESIQLLCECYQRQFEQLENSKVDITTDQQAELLAAVTKKLQPVITGTENRWPTKWSVLQRETAISLARLHLRYSNGPSTYAERLLRALVDAATPAEVASPAEQQATVQTLFVVSLARNGKAGEAQAVVANLGNGSSGPLLDAIEQLDQVIAQGPSGPNERQELGRLSLAIAAMLDGRRSELDRSTVAKLDAYRAAALAATGDRPAAIALYAQLAGQSPDDGELQERYARLLAASGSVAELRQALGAWLVVERRSRRGGPRWRRARQARMELLHRVGEPAEADKLLRLTRLLYPDWSSRGKP